MDFLKILQENITLETLYYVFSILVAFDVATGIIKAWKNGKFKSRTMRDGLFASLGELMLLALSIAISTLIPISRVVIFMLLIYMVLKEFGSILENLIDIGVNVPTWLIKGLKVYTDKIDNINLEE